MRSPRLRTQRPAFMIAPATPDLEVALGEALVDESGPFGERDRCRIPRLDVGFQTVQGERAERLTQDEPERFGHVPLAGEARDPAVTDVTVLEAEAHDLRHVQPAHERAVLAPAREVAH